MTAGRLIGVAATLALAAGCMQRVDVTPVTLNANGGATAPVFNSAALASSADHISATRTVPSGQDRQLAYFVSLHEDCTVMPGLDVRVLNPPGHGTAVVREGKDYPSYAAGNPHAACNKAAAPSQQLWYQPAPGFTGTDILLVQVFWPMGKAQTQTYTITVKDGGVKQPAAPAK
ncbi:hypothetical protein [Azospirillum sp. B4]|uniref:hypothetical protein n=1 Tax=Azospirillum sp. B4 TaxID=95605 RepID=UPI0011DE1BCF|nr:hypothetical protein [Azospirillum sp. B4]